MIANVKEINNNSNNNNNNNNNNNVKRVSTRILVIAKLNGRKDFILRGFFYDIIRPSKELPVQS